MPLRPGEESLKSGGNWLVGDAYYDLTRNCKWFFRLQVQPAYKVDWEQSEFKRFLETGQRDIDVNDPEILRAREEHAKGNIRQRVCVITPPLTDYQRWVFPGYHFQAEAGQDLRVLDTSTTENPGLPDYDFIFIDDSATAIKLHYKSDDGTYIGRELLPDADPAEYRRYRDRALASSIPFLEYEKLIANR